MEGKQWILIGISLAFVWLFNFQLPAKKLYIQIRLELEIDLYIKENFFVTNINLSGF